VKRPCQAVVVRYAPDPSAGEALNFGVVLLAPDLQFFGARFVDGWSRITGAFPQADRVHLRRMASTIEHACDALSGAQLALHAPDDVAAAFDKIIPREDASLVRSPAITGVTSDPERTLEELFQRYVVGQTRAPVRESRTDQQVWRSRVVPELRRQGVLSRLEPRTLKGKHYEETFDASWKNRKWNVARPLSFDMVDAHAIVTKAAHWTGRIIALGAEAQETNVHLVIGLPPHGASKDLHRASDDAIGLLREELSARDLAAVTLESEADELAARIKADLEHQSDE
jgi:hypothetical protein